MDFNRRNFLKLAGQGTMVSLLGSSALAQQAFIHPNELAERVANEPFVGVTIDGQIRDGLYKIQNTGLSNAAVVAAATAFLDSMTAEQRAKVAHSVDGLEWRRWSNMHIYRPNGVSLREMSHLQQLLADDLLRKSLSKQGYDNAKKIMRLNHSLAEQTFDFEGYGEYRYWFTIMGEPSATEPWGWQIDGHHLIINYLVIGDQVVMSPVFMGSEPTSATSGKYRGTTILQPEQKLGLEFMKGLSPKQQKLAILGPKGRGENVAEMFKDNVIVPYAGVPVAEMNARDRARVLMIARQYISNMPEDHAAFRIKEIEAHLDETYFAWRGDVTDDAVFYYRVHSPVILIEFGHQGPIALPGDKQVATRNHIHTVVRTPNGNDYGKALLALHQRNG